MQLVSLTLLLLLLRPQALRTGMLVTRVTDSSVAAKAGVLEGDVVVALNGQAIPSQEALEAVIGNRLQLTEIQLDFLRQGQPKTVKVEFPSDSAYDFGISGLPDMPRMLAEQVQKSHDPVELAKLAEAQAATGHDYLAGWIYIHAAELHSKGSTDYAKKGLKLFTADEDPALKTLGLVILMGPEQTAIDKMEEIVKTLELGRFTIYEADVLLSLGDAEFKLNRFMEAAGYLARAREILEEGRPGSRRLADLYHAAGLVATMAGKFALAEDMDLKAIRIREASMPDSVELAASYADAGLAAGQRADFHTAIYRLDKARAIFDKHPEDAELNAACNNDLAVCYQSLGELSKARSILTAGLAMEENLIPNSSIVGITETNLATLLLMLGKNSEASAMASRAVKFVMEKNPDSPEEAGIRNILGLIELSAKQYLLADKDFNRTAALYSRFAPDSVVLAIALTNQGSLAYREHRIARAKALYSQAMVVTEANRHAIVSPEERMHLQESTYMLPRFYSQALSASGDQLGAFLALESGRGRALAEMIAEQSVDFSSGAPANLVAKELDISQNQAGIKKQIAETIRLIEEAKKRERLEEVTSRSSELTKLRSNARELLDQQRDCERQIRMASPNYASLKFPQPLTKTQLNASLLPGDLVVAFNIMPDGAQILTCKKTGQIECKVSKVALTLTRLKSLAVEFRQAIVNQGDYKRTGKKLYDALIAPIMPDIKRCRHLILMTDLGVGELPFGAIPVGANKTLSDLAPISTQLSVSLFHELMKKPHAAKGFVGIAYPTAALDLHPLEGLSDTFRLSSRRVLPSAATEIRQIGHLYPSSKLQVDEQATLSRVLPLLSDARYIHFACHGVLDSASPLDSGLALCPEAGNDGLLLAKDFFKLTLHADLVTLSACDSGRGKETYSEGLVGFSRALHYAGARSVLVTLWPIEDQSTSLFMQAFYTALKKGATKDRAINAGIRTLKASVKFAHPRFWAPFVLSGAYN